MPATLIVSGRSEATYFQAVLQQGHPWADLTSHGVLPVDAKGDSQIPAQVELALAGHRKVLVVYDKDALARAGEQGSVIRNVSVRTHHLQSDFEGAFDAPIVLRALALMGYQSSIECLNDAQTVTTPFAKIRDCSQPAPGAQPLDKAPLAAALGAVSERWWYVPREFFFVLAELGELCGVQRRTQREGWELRAQPHQATGRLYVGNHVSNEHVAYWDFSRGELIKVPLPGKFDSSIALCRRGARVVVRKYERDASGFPAKTWVHVFDAHDGNLKPATQFRISGSVYELHAEEDGNHLQLFIQHENAKRSLRCLANGTQRQDIPTPAAVGLYTPKTSRSGKLNASGPHPLKIHKEGTEIASFPHFYAHSFTWSPCEEFLAFFARRWRQPPDFLWFYDLKTDRVHRLASGEKFIPTYWA